MTADAPTDEEYIMPVVDDLDTGGFWKATAQRKLAVNVCGQCGRVLHLPRNYCSYCNSWGSDWKECSGRGRVYSLTRVEQTINPLMPAPYTVLLVELEEHPGVRLVGQLRGSSEVNVGDDVEVEFEELAPEVVLPQWRAVSS